MAEVERQEEQVEEQHVPSLHETVEAAFDVVQKHTAGPEEQVEPEVEPEVESEVEEPEVEKPAKGPDRDPETGQFKPREEKPAQKKPAPAPQPRAQAKPALAPAKPAAASAEQQLATQDRAPQAWKAIARNKWALLDKLGEDGKVIKEELTRREREVNQRLAQDAPARELAGTFEQMVRPFMHLIPPGKSPMESIYGLMQTAAVLQTGSMQQRAIIAANIIRGYGIDLDMLASALDAGGNVAGPGQRPAQGGYDPRVDQLYAELQRRDRIEQERQREAEDREYASIEAEYEKFAETHPFFEDVRPEMADIIRVRASRGVATSDEEAYHMAVSLHPELVQLQQEQERAAATSQEATRRARKAAGSLAPRPGVRTEAVPATDLEGTISAAWDKHAGGRRA